MRQSIVAGLAVVCVTAGIASADSVSTSGRAALFQSQLAVLDGRASQQYNNSDRLLPTRAPSVQEVLPSYRGNYRGEYLSVARDIARKHGVPEDMFLRLVQQESGWNPGAVSPKGAIGLAQLMPGTAALLGVDPHDPRQNLDGGARYLRRQYEAFGSWRLALAAYNAGPEAVQRHGGIPPYAETVNYVKVILGS